MAPIVYLAHGASGNADSMLPHVRGLRVRGLAAETVQLPRTKAERAVSVYAAAVEAALDAGRQVLVGGHSFGGRVASLLATERRFAGLILLSYPLHPPGAPDRWADRTAHWPQIMCPVLLLSGDRDPFAKVELMRRAVEQLRDHELVIYPGLRHGIGPRLDDALDRVAAFARRVTESVHSGS